MPVEDYSNRELSILFGALATFIQVHKHHQHWTAEQKQEMLRLAGVVEEEMKATFKEPVGATEADQEIYRVTTKVGLALIRKNHNEH